MNKDDFIEACSEIDVGVIYFKQNPDGSVISIVVFQNGDRQIFEDTNAIEILKKVNKGANKNVKR